eukprot:COSAG02_NODE_50041_length_323_cov_0.683036_1_plen_83_part_01
MWISALSAGGRRLRFGFLVSKIGPHQSFVLVFIMVQQLWRQEIHWHDLPPHECTGIEGSQQGVDLGSTYQAGIDAGVHEADSL